MPIIYETTATIASDGQLKVDIANLPFETGTKFEVKLIPKLKVFDPGRFKERMQALMDECERNSPFSDMNKADILALLRRQREAMYGE